MIIIIGFVLVPILYYSILLNTHKIWPFVCTDLKLKTFTVGNLKVNNIEYI